MPFQLFAPIPEAANIYESRRRTEDGMTRYILGNPVLNPQDYPGRISFLHHGYIAGEQAFCDTHEVLVRFDEGVFPVMDIPHLYVRAPLIGQGKGAQLARGMVEVARRKNMHLSFFNPNSFAARLAQRLGEAELGTVTYDNDAFYEHDRKKIILIRINGSSPKKITSRPSLLDHLAI